MGAGSGMLGERGTGMREGEWKSLGAVRPGLVLALCLLPLAVLVVWLALDQFARQRRALLAELTGLASEQHHAVAQMLAGADRQLSRMRLTVEEAAPGPPPALVPVEAQLAGRRTAGTGRADEATGALIAIPGLSPQAPGLAGALAMLGVVEMEARLGTRSHWSYFFSAAGDFITIHPAVSLSDIAGAASAPPASVADLVRYWLGYEVFRMGTPAQNPERRPYWTPVYEDAGGAGPMVSHGAPVWAGDRFLGIVGTDVRLETFQEVLAHLNSPVGFLALLDARGEVLGLAGTVSGGEGAMRAAAGAGEFRRIGDDFVMARPLAGTPFRLVHVVPVPELNAHLLPRFVAYGWILLGLALTMGGLLLILHHFYVRPSFALGQWLYGQAAGQDPAPPRLPPGWRGMMARIAGAFAETRATQQALARSEARFLAATADLPQGFAIIDPAGRIAFRNAAFGRLLGAPEPQAGDALAGIAALAGLGEEPRLLHARWIARQDAPMSDGGHVVILRDVTTAREAELSLRDSEARYRTVVNTQTEFVVRYTPDGRPLFANDAYCRYMNIDPAAMAAREVSDFAYILPEDRAEHDAHLAMLSPDAPTCTVTFRSILADGSFHWEEWNDTGIFDAEGRLVEIQAVGRDITERRLAEETLRQSEKMAAMGSLLAGVAHELNNPLAIVLGYAGMLRDMGGDDATRRRAEEIHRAAERCARIVKSFLAMARSRPAERVAVDLAEVLRDALELAAYGLRSHGVEVAMDAPASLPPVLADRDQIHQVMMNLILNAQQAMTGVEGARRLSIRLWAQGGRVVVTLADTGPGIDPAVQPRLFDPFFTTKPQGMGTGIGLSVCQRIVQAHGGTIRLEPGEAGGAVATVELPEAAAEAGVLAPALPGPVLPAGRILVVDDEPGLLAWAAEVLAAAGLAVTACGSGREALAALERERFDAVLTDLRMPDIGGERLVAFIAAHRPALLPRVVVMTGDAMGSEVALGVPVGAIIEKPLGREELLATLAALLERKAA